MRMAMVMELLPAVLAWGASARAEEAPAGGAEVIEPVGELQLVLSEDPRRATTTYHHPTRWNEPQDDARRCG